MEMTAIYCYGAIGAIFCLVIGTLIGYAVCEGQQLHANAVQREHLTALDEAWRKCVADANANASYYEHLFNDAVKYRTALIDAVDCHGLWIAPALPYSPAHMLTNLLDHAAACVIDPAISQKAKNLYVKGVRAGAKKGRAQMQKLMQKSIDKQAATINELSRDLFNSQGKRQIYQEAVSNVLTDKVALPGVRKSIRNGIAEEVSRLYLVKAKNSAMEAV